MDAPRARVARRPVHGVLLLDKPLGLSSNQALQKAKWLLRAEKAGHTGTLDPLATGVLPLCFGAATKFSQLQLDADKTYEATLRLGVVTSTGDAEGALLCQRPVQVTLAQIQAVLLRFTGAQDQIPPMYSALKKDGMALYEYARRGIDVAREARAIQVHRLELLQAPSPDTPDRLVLRATVSKGTYIRTLAQDMGEALGCGASLSALRRSASTPFEARDSLSLDALESLSEDQRHARLLPTESLLHGHTRVMLGADDAARFLSGLRRRGDWADCDTVAVFGPPPLGARQVRLLGSAHVKAGELIPQRLLNPQEVAQQPDLPLPNFFESLS